jgi:hypothetical protein
MARSFGLPLLLPARIETVDLGEPDPRVFRFQNDTFIETLHHALSVAPDYSAAAGWRKQTAWETVAAQTAHVYERALNHTL